MASRTSASAKTPRTPLTADIDLDVAWRRTIAKVQNITDWKLDDSKELSVEDVITNLNPSKPGGGAEKSESGEQAKKVFRRTLHCIQTFGEIAAQGASMVFGPSNQCFNAVNFVITAAQGYSEAIDNISILMERMAVFLERLAIYLRDPSAAVKLDRNLRPPVYRVLDHFLVVMGNVHKITSSRRNKLKLAFKLSVLGEDSGIKDALGKLETVISQVTEMEITTIAKNLSEAAKSIRSLSEKMDDFANTLEKTAASTSRLQASDDRRSKADEEQKATAALRKFLGIDEKKEPWEDRQGELRRDRIEGTGEWLLNSPFFSFSRWSDPTKASLNVLSIKAQQGFGKSFLSSIVVDDLIKKHKGNPRVCIAYYYFNAERDQTDNRDSGKDSVNKALKSIIWQLAQTNRDAGREFRELAINKARENNDDLSKTEKLWNLFVSEHERALNATFYIVLDGLNQPESETSHPLARILDRIMASTNQQTLLQTRVLLTGQPAGLTTLMREMEQRPLEVSLAPPERSDEEALNHDDILLFAEDRLRDIPFYRATQESDDQVLKDRVKKTLARGVRGDFDLLKLKLGEIAEAREEAKVEEILRRADEDRAQAVERHIKQLNEKLTASEIEEVNIILIWVITGSVWPSVSLLDAVLSLQPRRNRLLGHLRQRIRERYSDLFNAEEDETDRSDGAIYVELWSEEIKNFLCNPEQQTMDIGRDAGRHLGEEGFHEAEIALVERVIKTHMRYVFGEDGQDIYAKYRFSEFFQSKREPTATQIQFRADRANIAIARSCLIALCDKYDDPDLFVLQDYAYMYFAVHLSRQIVGLRGEGLTLRDVEASAKHEIGRKLVKLLMEQTFIDAWLERWVLDADYWVYNNLAVDALHIWLKDFDVQRGLQDMPQERKWVADLSQEGVRSVAVLANIVVSIARVWLDGKHPGWPKIFEFLFGYFNQLKHSRALLYVDASVHEVLDVVSWAKKELPVEAEDSRWSFCTGMALYGCELYDAALPKFREALEMKPDYWKAKQHIAISLGFKDNYEEAVRTMNDLIEMESSRLDTDTEYYLEYWNYILPSIVDWNERLGDHAAAQTASQKLVTRVMQRESMDEDSRDHVKQHMSICIKQQKHSEIVQLLEELAVRANVRADWFVQILHSSYDDDDFHDTILEVGKNSKYSTKIMESYQAAIDEASRAESMVIEEMKLPVLVSLRTMLARLQWYLASTMKERHSAIPVWQEILLEELDEDNIHFAPVIWTRRTAVNLAGSALVTAAKEGGSGALDTDVAEKCLQRLEKLQEIDHATGRHQVRDLRLPLARLLYLMKQPERAKNVIRGYMSLAVQILEESKGENEDACSRLACVFLVFDDDVNAFAAFTLFSRKQSNGAAAVASSSAEQSADKLEPEAKMPGDGGHILTTTIQIANDVPSTEAELNAQHNGTVAEDVAEMETQGLDVPHASKAVSEENVQPKSDSRIAHNGNASDETNMDSLDRSDNASKFVEVKGLGESNQEVDTSAGHGGDQGSEVVNDVDTTQVGHSKIDPETPLPLPEGWIARFDETSKCYYYIHLPTLSTQWEFPRTSSSSDLQKEEPETKPGAETESRYETLVPKQSLSSLTRLDTNMNSDTSPKDDAPAPSSSTSSEPGPFRCISVGCDYEWDVGLLTDLYACRDCCDVLCPDCYDGFKKGTKLNCHESHSHLHVPPVEDQKFLERSRDSALVLVAGEEMPLQQWLDNIKSEWGLEQKSVKARERLINAVRWVIAFVVRRPGHMPPSWPLSD